eukprot:235501-Heterocapsa_arctica.AAC.1
MVAAAGSLGSPSAFMNAVRKIGSMDPAFSASTCVTRSGLAVSTAQRRRGSAKKCLESGPHRPVAPLSLPMV